jgi:hypothetical protein
MVLDPGDGSDLRPDEVHFVTPNFFATLRAVRVRSISRRSILRQAAPRVDARPPCSSIALGNDVTRAPGFAIA